MKFLIIEGNVVGGHRIDDLGLNVPYGEEVRVHFDRASWSSDLAYAVKNGLVEKKGVRNPRRGPKVQRASTSVSKTNHDSGGGTEDNRDDGEEKDTQDEVQRILAAQEEDRERKEEVAELREMNKRLMDKLDTMAESQMALLSKMSEFMEREEDSGGKGVDEETLKRILSSLPASSGNSSGSQRTSSGADDVVEDEVVYIPSQIRSDKIKVSDRIDVEEGKAKGDGVASAAKALAAMRKSEKEDGESDDS